MTFYTEKEIADYVLKRSEIAIKMAQEKVYEIIDVFLKKFYSEFSPEVYIRTYQLLQSLVKSDVKRVGNSLIAEVYFDLSALDYSKRITPVQFPANGRRNTYHRADWTDENTKWVLDTAMTGSYPHGGYAGGTAIWTEAMKVYNSEKAGILKKMLIDAGIPVK